MCESLQSTCQALKVSMLSNDLPEVLGTQGIPRGSKENGDVIIIMPFMDEKNSSNYIITEQENECKKLLITKKEK